MKNSVSSLFYVLFAIMIAFFFTDNVIARKPGALKIGVYDSRVIIFAYSRSDLFRQHQAKFKQQSDSAGKVNDTVRIKELTIQAISYQHLFHQMIFGTGSTAAIIDLVKEGIPEIAKKAGVIMVVSKFELTYKDPSAEIVDLTNEIVRLFKPLENIDKMAGEIRNVQPVPLEDLTIEEDMMDGYAKRYGKK
jgi:hypothetical protein